MVFIVHGAMSLDNDQIKTVAKGVLRVCILCMHRDDEQKLSMGEFRKLHCLCFRQVLFHKRNKEFRGRAVSYSSEVRGKAPKTRAFS